MILLDTNVISERNVLDLENCNIDVVNPFEFRL